MLRNMALLLFGEVWVSKVGVRGGRVIVVREGDGGEGG